jgi:hypothetical protein
MKRARWFAGLMFPAVLAASASPEVRPGSGGASLVQVARGSAPRGPDLGLLNRASPAATMPLTTGPMDEARRKAASAVAFLLAVVFPW